MHTTTAQAAPEVDERPQRADARANRERILLAASQVFGEQGINVPITTVAERAGVGVGTLYRHFPTKEDLFEAIVIDHFRSLVAQTGQWAMADDPIAAFDAFVDVTGDAVLSKRDLADALSKAGVDYKAGVSDQVALLEGNVAVILQRAQSAGAVRADVQPGDVILLIQGTCAAAEQAGRCPDDTKRMLTVILDGLRTQPRG